MSLTEAPESAGISFEELQLAARNHGMPLEGLRYDVTPVGMHYLLIHFDIPETQAAGWTVQIGGRVRTPLSLSLDEIGSRPRVTQRVTMECAGNGRARLEPRPISQPWVQEAVGTAEWTGASLAPILEEAGVEPEAVELVFAGADHGIQGGIEHDYERSLAVADAMRPEVLLAYEIDGQPLPPQHGAPIRLLVPGWYGMTSVKWLTSITAIDHPFDGFQQWAYKSRQTEDEEGTAVARMEPRALMVPPGFPDFLARTRTVDAGRIELMGRAWSGFGGIELVEISTNGGTSWSDALLGPVPESSFAWRAWSFGWDAGPGDHELVCRATDGTGRTQPIDQPWNYHGLANNMVQRVPVTVR